MEQDSQAAPEGLEVSSRGQETRERILRPQRDSNPRRRRERAMSWASRRWGLSPYEVGRTGIEPVTVWLKASCSTD